MWTTPTCCGWERRSQALPITALTSTASSPCSLATSQPLPRMPTATCLVRHQRPRRHRLQRTAGQHQGVGHGDHTRRQPMGRLEEQRTDTHQGRQRNDLLIGQGQHEDTDRRPYQRPVYRQVRQPLDCHQRRSAGVQPQDEHLLNLHTRERQAEHQQHHRPVLHQGTTSCSSVPARD